MSEEREGLKLSEAYWGELRSVLHRPNFSVEEELVPLLEAWPNDVDEDERLLEYVRPWAYHWNPQQAGEPPLGLMAKWFRGQWLSLLELADGKAESFGSAVVEALLLLEKESRESPKRIANSGYYLNVYWMANRVQHFGPGYEWMRDCSERFDVEASLIRPVLESSNIEHVAQFIQLAAEENGEEYRDEFEVDVDVSGLKPWPCWPSLPNLRASMSDYKFFLQAFKKPMDTKALVVVFEGVLQMTRRVPEATLHSIRRESCYCSYNAPNPLYELWTAYINLRGYPELQVKSEVE